MSEQQLRDMIAFASDFCDKKFRRDGEVRPMWHAVTSAGKHFPIAASLGDKDADIAMVRALFELEDVVRYVFMNEAWTMARLLTDAEVPKIKREGISKHPDRVEVLMLSGEDSDYGMIMMQRKIVRPPGGKPYLGPLTTLDELPYMPHGATMQSEGRMVGLLPARGVRH